MTSTLPKASQPDPASLQPTARPGAHGRFGRFGGQYVPETLMPALAELEQSAAQAWADPAFTGKLNHLLKTYVGRATPLYEAERLTTHYRRDDGGPRIWLKREDLNHTGAHSTDLTKLQAVPHPASQHTPSNVVHLCVRILHDEILRASPNAS